MTESVLNGGGGIYEQMKKNMEKTVVRENERFQRRQTIKQIKERDADDKQKQAVWFKRNNSEAHRRDNDRSASDDRGRDRSRDDRRQQQKNLFTKSRSPVKQDKHKRQPSPHFRSPSGMSDASKSKSEKRNSPTKKYTRTRTALTEASEMPIPGAPTIEQIKEQHRMNALKVVDIYRQLQNSPLLAVHDLRENQLVAAEIDLSNMNSHSTSRVASQPDDSHRSEAPMFKTSQQAQSKGLKSSNRKNSDKKKQPKPVQLKPTLTSAARNPSNDDIITSTFIHILSAFAIAEAQQDIFLRIKSYVILNGFELPKLNGIYNGYDFNEVRKAKTRYLHFLFSQAMQTAIHANWISMAHTIMVHCKEMHLSLQVSKMDLSVLISNANFELMNLLIEYGAYFDRNERSIEAERMKVIAKKQSPLDQTEDNGTEHDTVSERNIWWNQTGFKKNNLTQEDAGTTSMKELSRSANLVNPFKRKLDKSFDNYSRALTNLDATRMSMLTGQGTQHETSMMQNLKRGLVAGHSQLNASHFVRQLYDDRAALGPTAENHKRFQIQIRELLKALCASQSFQQVIPLLVLRGNRDLVYDMLTDKQTSRYSFELSFETQKSLALEFFCFSVSQEQLDEAINVLLKFQSSLTNTHRKKCLNELMSGLKRSAAFLELKFFLISQYYSRMSQTEALELLDIIENRLIATYRHQSQHRSALLQNANSLKASLLTLFIMGKLSKLIPHSEKRVSALFVKVIDQQGDILDKTPHTEFDKIILSCNRKDIFGNDVLYYLACTQPGRLLKCQVIQKLIDQHWSARPSTSSTALLHHSTCSQIVFHGKLRQHVPMKKLILGNDSEASSSLAEAKEHLVPAVNFKAWKQGLNMRFTVDCLLSIALVAFLQYITIAYLHKELVIKESDPFVSFLLQFVYITKIEEANQTGQAGYFLAFYYTFVIGGLYLVAIVAKGILSALYLAHTGYRGHQRISVADTLIFFCVAIFSIFFIYVERMREPEYYEEIEQWGELIYDGSLLKFNANLHNLESSTSMPVSVRFWPFLVLAAMWFHILSRLQLHRGIGAYVIMMRLAAIELGKFFVFWVVSLTFFAWVTLIWLGDFENYSDYMGVIRSLYLTSLGLIQQPVQLEAHREVGFNILHAIFIIVNLIGFISFLTAMMTQTLVESRSRLVSMQNGYFVERLPKERYHEKAGWIAATPLLLAPFSLFFTYPCFLITKKLVKAPGAKTFNLVICAMVYFPMCLLQLLAFAIMNLILMPLAYAIGLYQLITQNPYQDRQKKLNKALQVVIWIFLGLPFLFVAQFPNAFFCVLSLYAPKRNFDALYVESKRQQPVNTRNLQRMYQIVSAEVLEQAQESQHQFTFPAKHTGPFNRAKQLLERLRNSLGIMNCVKTLFLGSIPGATKGSARFLHQLKREGQSITSQLQCYNMLKTQVIGHKDHENELRLGLLFQYLQELKMKIVTVKVLANYKQGKEMRMLEFVNIYGSNKTDAIARDILQTNPNLVLQILQTEEQASQGLKESFFVQELHQMQAQILGQIKRQALQSHMLQGATMEQLRDNHSMMSTSDSPNLAPIETDPRKKHQSQVNQLQLAIAQQEAVYSMARQRQQHGSLDPQDHINTNMPSIRVTDMANMAEQPKNMVVDRSQSKLTAQQDMISDAASASVTHSETPTDIKAGFLRKKTMTSKV